jgi:hypothetical protein
MRVFSFLWRGSNRNETLDAGTLHSRVISAIARTRASRVALFPRPAENNELSQYPISVNAVVFSKLH